MDGNKANNHVSNLEWVTNSENQKHSYAKLGRVPIRLCGEDNGCSKLNNKQVKEIKKLLRGKVSQNEIADIYNISQQQVSKIKLGLRWNYYDKRKECKT